MLLSEFGGSGDLSLDPSFCSLCLIALFGGWSGRSREQPPPPKSSPIRLCKLLGCFMGIRADLASVMCCRQALAALASQALTQEALASARLRGHEQELQHAGSAGMLLNHA